MLTLLTNMVNVQTHQTFYKKYGKRSTAQSDTHQEGQGILCLPREMHYARKQMTMDDQTKTIFPRNAKTTKKSVLQLECTKPNYKGILAKKRYKHFEVGGDKQRKRQMVPFWSFIVLLWRK